MGCSPEVLERIDAMITASLRKTGSRDEVNLLLERRFDAAHRATEWDAEQWGFDPHGWCSLMRLEMSSRERGLRAAARRRLLR